MQPRLALGLAIAAAAVAIGAVAIDLAYELEAKLQTNKDGDWETVASGDPYYYDSRPYPSGCSSRELRLVVDNHRLVGESVDVVVTYQSGSQGMVTLLDDTWDLGRAETRSYDFTIPQSALTMEDPNYGRPYVYVNAQVGDMYLSTCVEGGA